MKKSILLIICAFFALFAVNAQQKGTFTITSSATAGGTLHPLGVSLVEENDHSEIYVFDSNEGYYVKTVLIDGVNDLQAILDGLYRFLYVNSNHTIQIFFAPKSHTITASATEGGFINPVGSVVVPDASGKTFFFTENTGYQLVRVLIDGNNNTGAVQNFSYTFTDIVKSHTIAAQFEKKVFQVSLPEIEGAHVIPTSGSASPVEYGGKFMFVVEIEAGYTAPNLTVRANGIILNPADGVFTISNIEANQTVTVDGVEKVITGIKENNEETIKIYSHENIVTIENKNLIPLVADIFDMAGRMVWQGQITTQKAEIPLNVVAGVYGVRVVGTSSFKSPETVLITIR